MLAISSWTATPKSWPRATLDNSSKNSSALSTWLADANFRSAENAVPIRGRSGAVVFASPTERRKTKWHWASACVPPTSLFRPRIDGRVLGVDVLEDRDIPDFAG